MEIVVFVCLFICLLCFFASGVGFFLMLFSNGLDNQELNIIIGFELPRSIISLFLLLSGHAYLSRKKKNLRELN